MSKFLDKILKDVGTEVERAVVRHGPLNSPHEAYAVILEELDEVKEEVWMKSTKRDLPHMRLELIQTAAMCVRAIHDLIDVK